MTHSHLLSGSLATTDPIITVVKNVSVQGCEELCRSYSRLIWVYCTHHALRWNPSLSLAVAQSKAVTALWAE
jgi:hypothetical protein